MHENTHIAYFDYLRTFGILAVVLLHAFSSVLFIFEPVADINWWWGNLIASSTHWAVPVFFMISGALHLGKDIGDYKKFYLKKVKRLLFPLVCFIAFFASVYAFLRGDALSVSNIIHRLIFDEPYEHLYFLIALFFLFVITPFLNYLLRKYPQQSKLFYVVSLLYTLFIFPTRFIGLFWLPFLSYYLAGYFLQRQTKHLNNSLLAFCILVSFAITMIGTALLTTHTIPNSDGFYLFGVSSPLTIILSYSLFLLFKQIFQNKSVSGTTKMLADTAFGIYLLHPFFLLTFSTILFSSTFPKSNLYMWERLLLFIMTTIVSFITVYIFQQRKYLKTH